MMNELQRMQYLDALGIDTFVPRFILPGAAASQASILPPAEEVVSSVAEGSMQVARGSFAEAIMGGEESRSPGPEVSALEKQKGTAVATEADQSVQHSLVRFSLSLWRVSPSIEVIDSRQVGAALPTERLLENILYQMQLMVTPLPRAEILNWPLVQDRAEDQGWVAAREMTLAFLEGVFQSQPVESILIMGNDALQAVLGENQDFASSLYQTIFVDTLNANATILPSLSDLLQSPLEKQKLWAVLKTLS